MSAVSSHLIWRRAASSSLLAGRECARSPGSFGSSSPSTPGSDAVTRNRPLPPLITTLAGRFGSDSPHPGEHQSWESRCAATGLGYPSHHWSRTHAAVCPLLPHSITQSLAAAWRSAAKHLNIYSLGGVAAPQVPTPGSVLHSSLAPPRPRPSVQPSP